MQNYNIIHTLKILIYCDNYINLTYMADLEEKRQKVNVSLTYIKILIFVVFIIEFKFIGLLYLWSTNDSS